MDETNSSNYFGKDISFSKVMAFNMTINMTFMLVVTMLFLRYLFININYIIELVSWFLSC